MTEPKRKYTKRARAAGEQRTRENILAATQSLWSEIGPAATSISAIARGARVQRLTVYRHFTDDAALVQDAWAAFLAEHPPPDPAAWATVEPPPKRLRRALRSLYAYYDEAGAVLANVLHDAHGMPALQDAVALYESWLEGVVATLETGWTARGGKRDRDLPVSMLEHAVRLSTWRSLSERGMDTKEAARLFERAMSGLAKKGSKK